MIGARIRNWAAWAPELEGQAAWQDWANAPSPLGVEGSPAARFLPAMLRRRCSPLARMMLTAAFECCEEADLSNVATVFASRHGNINESVGMFDRLAREQPLSPTRFSHTVHNAQAGLFSIAAGVMLIFLTFVMLAAERRPESDRGATQSRWQLHCSLPSR